MRSLTIILLLIAAACADGEDTTPSTDTRTSGYTCGEVAGFTAENTAHVSVGTEVEYSSDPPSIGNHYGQWLAWGHYDSPLDPRYYVHNLEHGGLAILYDCEEAGDPVRCPEDLVEPLKAWADAMGEDDGGPFRFVSSPYPDLDVPLALVAWGQTYRATCLDTADLDRFEAAHYRKAPEDIAAGGQHAL